MRHKLFKSCSHNFNHTPKKEFAKEILQSLFHRFKNLLENKVTHKLNDMLS